MQFFPPSLLLALGSLACATAAPAPAEDPPVLVSGEPSAVFESTITVEFDQAHTLWTKVLKERVREDEFDYGGLAKDKEDFAAYLKQLHAVTPAQLAAWTKEERFAFWINAYNAHTILKVIDNYPLDSIRDLDGALGLKSVFDNEFIPMKGHHPDGKNDRLSLNDIEHEILRKEFEDARLHAAVNCASAGCPPLRGEAFVAAKLDEQLDEQMRTFVNDPKRNRYDAAKGQMRISEIFKWFQEDFDRDAGSVKEYLLRYAAEENAAVIKQAKVRYLDYGWKLNDAREKGRG